MKKDEYQILYLNPSDVPENYFFMDDLPADAMEYVCHEYRSIPASEVYHSYSDLCRKCKSLPTFQEADSAYMSYRDAISFICPTSFTAYLRAMTPYFLPRHLGMGVYFMNSEEE